MGWRFSSIALGLPATRHAKRPNGTIQCDAVSRVPSPAVTDDEIHGGRAMPDPDYDDRGLVPCIVQDWRTGEVLTLAYMNAEALARTRETGELHFWSRSRDELW